MRLLSGQGTWKTASGTTLSSIMIVSIASMLSMFLLVVLGPARQEYEYVSHECSGSHTHTSLDNP